LAGFSLLGESTRKQSGRDGDWLYQFGFGYRQTIGGFRNRLYLHPWAETNVFGYRLYGSKGQ
jgi:hypothetical protein